MSMIRAGELNKRIELQPSSRAANGTGGFVTTWATTETVWAAIWPISAADVIEGMKTSAQTTHRVRIRFRKDVNSAMRIKYGNRYFSIQAPPINPNMANEYLDLVCKEAA